MASLADELGDARHHAGRHQEADNDEQQLVATRLWFELATLLVFLAAATGAQVISSSGVRHGVVPLRADPATLERNLQRKFTGGLVMPQSWTNKDERQYEHIKDSAKKEGRSAKRAKQIAAATVNKRRRSEGRTKKR
jgi:hypothetical protein